MVDQAVPSPVPRPADDRTVDAWRRFARLFGLTVLVATLGLYGVVLALDPYGLFASAKARPGPIMDLNQRFMYPQIVRGRRYDSAVIGSSTVRLIDPRQLDALFGGRFANLAMNAATPWEQMQIAGLFLRETLRPATLIIGVDPTWCEADADVKRLTSRSFPPWLYDGIGWKDWPQLINLKSAEIAARVAANRLGLMRERIRGDGYEVFTPPEASYDLARAQSHIWNGPPRAIVPVEPAADPGAGERAQWRMPALAWLDDLLGRLPGSTRALIVLPPVHVAYQPVPGSLAAARDGECKARLTEIAARHGATLADFRLDTPVTRADSNYWDALHYRLAIARQFADALRSAADGTSAGENGFYRVLAHTLTPPG
jgi:hypothetical protein